MRPFHAPFLRLVLALSALSAVANVFAQTPGTDEKRAIVYRLSRTDRINISIVGEPDLTASRRIDAKGNINLNLVGEVNVVGQTVAQAQVTIANAYRDGRFLRNPQVTIAIEEYAPRTVSISGIVKQPGTYPLPPETVMTIKELVLKAGGFGETANGKDVRVSRTMPDGSTKIFHLNVDAVLKGKSGKSEDNNFILEPDDIIYVPENLI